MYKKVVHSAQNKTKKNKLIISIHKPKRELKHLEWLALAPLIVMVAFVPLIVYAKIIKLTHLEELNWIGIGSIDIEFFSYYKALFFVIAIALGFILLVILHFLKTNRIIKTRYYIPLFVYTFFVILSYIFAMDKVVATRGFIQMHQGFYVLISYVLLVFMLINLVRKEKHVWAFLYAFLFVGALVSLIGIGQYFGYDIFRTEQVMLLILPKVLESIKDEIIINFGLFGIYATMGNSNFVGSFAALMIPLGFSLYFYLKNYLAKLFAFIFVGLMIFVTYGSNSRAGLVGVLISLLIFVILFRKQFLIKPVTALMPILVILTMGIALNVVTDGAVINEIKSMNLIREIDQIKERNETRVFFENIEVFGMSLLIETSDQSIIIEKRLPTLYAYELNGESLELIENNGTYTFSDPNYQQFRMVLDPSNAYFTLRAYNQTLTVYHTNEGLKLLGNNNELVIPEKVDRLTFLDGYESLFSSRGYIWSRSTPLLLNTIFIGAGPDHFTVVFPQNDFLGKLNNMGMNIIVDKPHNMYLQIGINTGLISLFAMIVLWVMYIWDSLKLYYRGHLESFLDYIGAGLFASVIAYLSAGFFNDQIMTVAPLFYTVLGLGIAINRINNHKLKLINDELLIQ